MKIFELWNSVTLRLKIEKKVMNVEVDSYRYHIYK